MIADGGQALLSLKPEVFPHLLLLKKVFVDWYVAVLKHGRGDIDSYEIDIL